MKSLSRAMTLVLLGAVALAGCKGSKGDPGQPGDPGAPGTTGSTGATGATGGTGTTGPGGRSSDSTGLVVNVVGVTGTGASATDPVTVHFTLKDSKGYPVDISGVYSVNTVMSPRFGLAYYTVNATTGNVQPYTVLTASGATPSPTVYNPTSTGQGTLTEIGTGGGDYQYTFPTSATTNGAVAVAVDPASTNTHVLWIQIARQTNTANADDPTGFTAVNADYWWVPAGGTPVKRELVKSANCYNCHRGFKPGEGSIATSPVQHGSGRIDARFCNICHNPARVAGSGPLADSKSFVHRIHDSANLQPQNIFVNTTATYPQDIRNCAMCHGGAAQGNQYKTNPSRMACGSCHDYVNFLGTAAAACTHPPAQDANGVNITCNHNYGTPQTDDTNCTSCHDANDRTNGNPNHVPLAVPDANNIYANPTSTGNANTNAGWLAAAGAVPAGAKKVTWQIAWVDTVPVTGGFQPFIAFRALVDGTPTALNTFAAGTTEEILPGFVGSPSVYFAYAVPQDGVSVPADFNLTASAYLRSIWNGVGEAKTSGTATTGTQGGSPCTVGAQCTCSNANPCLVPAGAISGPDADRYYYVRLTNTVIPPTATMLTGGIGYNYSLGSISTSPRFIGNQQPLTQIDLQAYPYTPNACTGVAPGASCGGVGGLIVPAPNVWKVANGFSGRRAVVDNAKCKACHVQLGAEPTFHAGQRNDGPTCVFCHTPNRTSSAWSATAKGFIHGLHAARIRSVPFTWHAADALGVGYSDVQFPGPLNNCTACHVPGGYDFSAAATTKTSGTSTIGTKGTTICTIAAPCTCTVALPCQTETGAITSGTSKVGTRPTTACTLAAPCTCGTGVNACVLTASGASAFPNLLVSTVGQGTYTAGLTLSPYVATGTNYGVGFATSNITSGTYNGTTCTTASPCVCTPAAPCQAEPSTLVISPIAAACVGCHDAPRMIDHMQANGGRFYETRAVSVGAGAAQEQCMICHGPNTIAPIADVHR